MNYDSLGRLHFMRKRLMKMLPMKTIQKQQQEEIIIEQVQPSPLALKLKKQELESREEALIKLTSGRVLDDRRREKEPVTLKRDGSRRPGYPGSLKHEEELDTSGLDGVSYHWSNGYRQWHNCSKNELFFRFVLKTYYEHRTQLSAATSIARRQYLRHRLMRFYIDSIKLVYMGT
eukprot:TRINITY_DN3494_c0_g1_i1.p3 TRINITY_DN3494_c0_g1~~TRINITY_DN3494_c0_g1_i1.p3  ORF type:complete len:175 (-),score=5.87 TRINITY_DN3494_c0_g1_i1:406-930(-)